MTSHLRAIIIALTGDDTAPSSPDGTHDGKTALPTSVGDLMAMLKGIGWGVDRLRAHAEHRGARGLPWPGPLPPETLRSVGPARWHALVQGLVSLLGLGADVQPPSPRRPLTQDERRLLREVPPHHGPVG